MLAEARKYFIAFSFTLLFLAFTGGPAFSTLYTIDAKDDAGLYLGQTAYAPQFVDNNGVVLGTLTSQPNSAESVYTAAYNQGIAANWSLVSAGNTWSSTPDTKVGDIVTLPAGMYRISVVGGGFTYDSFGWSGPEYSNKWLWGMNIESQWTDGNGQTVGYDYWLGSGDKYGTAEAALRANDGTFLDIGLGGPGSLSFWISDGNSIDNGGNLTFSITSVPEPSTLPFLAGVFSLLLVPRVRTYLAR